MQKIVAILQHVENEDAGTIRDYLHANGAAYQPIRLHRGEALPPPETLAALVVMGGPMSVYEDEKYPFLGEETRYIGEAVRRGLPCLGVCLGAQLIAKSLGAKVYKASGPEIGWSDVQLLEAAQSDRVLGSVQKTVMRVLQWHEDTFDLPPGAAHLAASGRVPHQAFRVGGKAYGFQFHIEVDARMLGDWFKNSESLGQILRVHREYAPELKRLTDGIYASFFSMACF